MTTMTTARLNRLKYHGTLYELTLTNGTQTYLVGYTSKGRPGMFRAVQKQGVKIAVLCGSEQIHFARRVADGAKVGEWTINFSGRTERDAIASESEIPFVGNL